MPGGCWGACNVRLLPSQIACRLPRMATSMATAHHRPPALPAVRAAHRCTPARVQGWQARRRMRECPGGRRHGLLDGWRRLALEVTTVGALQQGQAPAHAPTSRSRLPGRARGRRGLRAPVAVSWFRMARGPEGCRPRQQCVSLRGRLVGCSAAQRTRLAGKTRGGPEGLATTLGSQIAAATTDCPGWGTSQTACQLLPWLWAHTVAPRAAVPMNLRASSQSRAVGLEGSPALAQPLCCGRGGVQASTSGQACSMQAPPTWRRGGVACWKGLVGDGWGVAGWR